MPNGEVHRPKKLDEKKLRPEPAIREDLREQLRDMFTRWELWKCQS